MSKLWISISAVIFSGIAILLSLLRSNTSSTVPFGSGEMFDQIATYYDQGNEYLSLGLHKTWKSDLLFELKLTNQTKLLDLATGTADVAVMAAALGAAVTGLDPSPAMLAVAREKIKSLNMSVALIQGDAQDLSEFAEGSFDRVSISFGIRNVPDRVKALQEALRVLKKGGLLGVLELTPPDEADWTGRAVGLAVKTLVPVIGWAASGRAAEYAYLERSIFDFPKNFDFVVEQVGFKCVKIKSYLGGLVKIFVAKK